MSPSRTTTWLEAGVALAAITLYVTAYLLREAAATHALWRQAASVAPAAALERSMAVYQQPTHTLLPVLAGAGLLLLAWVTSHYLALPRLTKSVGATGTLYMMLSLLLLFGSVWVAHYFKLYLRLQYNQLGAITGLKVYSLYRSKTLFADWVAAGIGLGVYELLGQLLQYVRQRLPLATEAGVRYAYRGLVIGLVVLGLTLAWTVPLPPTLWDPQTGPWLLLAGLGLLVMVLQALAYPLLTALRIAGLSRRWVWRIAWWGSLALLGSTVLWVAYSSRYPVALRPLAGLWGLVMLVSSLVVVVRQGIAQETTSLQAQASHSLAELAGLRAQINPHFLFNALNSLYATALQESSDKTAEGIQQLGEMMRFLLEENNRDRILLQQEVHYLRRYIGLQRLRLDETQGLDIRINLQEPEQEVYLAPMLLSPFLENAFNHGISFQAPSWIHITLTLDATHLYFKVHNSLHPRAPQAAAAPTPQVGLENVRKRLALLYPGRHQLEIQQSPQDYFVALTLLLW
ncbi:sensor histidine kinase [Hymenobacter sp. GOD-10R]|uniref:sensor histidine kinase n=1 Tax=Hymenobacter sp. GOD-10R TaxID=3093922 RepID=UPI002D772DB5|nr:histidine kinase [Hymenobacter sp. GOD-10R]WRQ31099.1 histidine kinase [Hymenobacter sp. GOD-10R]